MVAVGDLAREDCSQPAMARMGTIIKVTSLVLHKEHSWERELQSAKFRGTLEVDHIIRPGKVASVRWQDDPSRVSIHVFYDDCPHAASINYNSNKVSLVK